MFKGDFFMEESRYNPYSKYLLQKYGCKVYKLPVNIPCTCPNRDGVLGIGGCIYCGEKGAGYEDLSSSIPVREQLEKNMEYIRDKYKAQKFIAYFQNFSNTYLPLDTFKRYMCSACIEDIVEISISTRPDCVNDKYLEFLKEIKDRENVNISMELGLQTVNYHTLKTINMGHTLAEFIDAVLRIKNHGFEVCSHVILDLPWDNVDDVIECAKVLSSLRVDQVKIHSLYIVRDTELENMYREGRVSLLPMDDYVNRVIAFLEYLSPQIALQRLIGRAPEEDTVLVNWNTSWWKIRDRIEEEMAARDTYQGKKCGYLNGKALKRFID
jgi:uncharacterized protein